MLKQTLMQCETKVKVSLYCIECMRRWRIMMHHKKSSVLVSVISLYSQQLLPLTMLSGGSDCIAMLRRLVNKES